MPTRPGYAPPPISPRWLTAELLQHYPNHTKSEEHLESLAAEYIKFWRLVLNYPDKRIVAPGPIIAVQRVHWNAKRGEEADLDPNMTYIYDCMTYFRKFLRKELIWRGRLDILGAVHTVLAYKDLYHELPPPAWQDITDVYNLEIPGLYVVH